MRKNMEPKNWVVRQVLSAFIVLAVPFIFRTFDEEENPQKIKP